MTYIAFVKHLLGISWKILTKFPSLKCSIFNWPYFCQCNLLALNLNKTCPDISVHLSTSFPVQFHFKFLHFKVRVGWAHIEVSRAAEHSTLSNGLWYTCLPVLVGSRVIWCQISAIQKQEFAELILGPGGLVGTWSLSNGHSFPRQPTKYPLKAIFPSKYFINRITI